MGSSKALTKKAKQMKRIGYLYDKIISVDNLRLADEKARKGKKNTYGVRVHDRNREANILKLHEQLKNKTYRTSKYDVFTIHEPKERQIFRLPYYPDRIVHHAIMNVLEPIWVSIFPHNTFSCIKGRGIEGCARYVDKIIKSYKDAPKLYCLKIDIKKFYPSINHDVLKVIVRKKIKDKDVLWLLDEIIDSADGLPIGNYVSQYLANLYLAYMLHIVNERIMIATAEYADDFPFISTDKTLLHKLLHEFIEPYLRDELHLLVKGNWQVFPIARNSQDRHGRALDFVGYKFFREQRLMRKSTKQNFCRMTRRLNRRRMNAKRYKQEICPWLGWAQHSDSRNLLKTIIKKEYYESVL